MKFMVTVLFTLLISLTALGQTWIPATVSQVRDSKITGVYAPGLSRTLRIHHLREIDPVVGEEFYLLKRGKCLSAFTSEEQDRARFDRHPVNVDCEHGATVVRNVSMVRGRVRWNGPGTFSSDDLGGVFVGEVSAQVIKECGPEAKPLNWELHSGRSAIKYAHAQKTPKAIVPPDAKTPAISIPVPAEDALAIKEVQQTYQAKKAALEAETERIIERILARAALRVKLTVEQWETLVAQGDGKGGFIWVKPEIAKSEPPKP